MFTELSVNEENVKRNGDEADAIADSSSCCLLLKSVCLNVLVTVDRR